MAGGNGTSVPPTGRRCGQTPSLPFHVATIPAAGRGAAIHTIDQWWGERTDGASMGERSVEDSGADGSRWADPASTQAGRGRADADAADPYRHHPYCPVTIVCGHRQLDLALPTTVHCSDLLPGLLRLFLADRTPVVAQPWVLIPMGREPLSGRETLAKAGVLTGDMLILEQRSSFRPTNSAVVVTRDRIEDIVNGQQRFWGQRTARNLAAWSALLTGMVLLLPATTLPVGPLSAATSATVALVIAMTAVASHRRSESVRAAAGLVLACVWAAVAGATGLPGLPADLLTIGGTTLLLTLMAATGSALLLAGCAAVSYPSALVHTVALLVIGIAIAGLSVAVGAGATLGDVAGGSAVLAVLSLGWLPRLALATAGLTGSAVGGDSATLDHRINRADRVLIGSLTGVSIVAAGAVIPGALSNADGPRASAVGIGLLLLLRSRAFTQTRHVLAPRVAGLLVFGVAWLGLYRDDSVPRSVLIVGAVLATAAWVAVLEVLSRAPSPVGLARRGRLLDLAERVLVVGQIVLTAWVIVLADWVISVVG